MKKTRIILFVFLPSLLGVSGPQLEVSEAVFLSHNLDMEINVEKHMATFSDQGLMAVKKGANLLYLPPNAQVESFSLNGKALEFKTGKSIIEKK